MSASAVVDLRSSGWTNSTYGRASELVYRVTQYPFPRRIQPREVAIEVGDTQHVERQVEESIELFFSALAVHELPDLSADPCEHSEQLFVRLADLVAEELHHSNDRSADQDREAKCGVQSFLSGNRRAREISIVHHVVNPRWLASGPDSTG